LLLDFFDYKLSLRNL